MGSFEGKEELDLGDVVDMCFDEVLGAQILAYLGPVYTEQLPPLQ